MWTYNSDYNKWYANDDSISKTDFDYLKQELKATRFYSRCLSGATYLPVNDLMNIYDILGEYKQRDWYISTLGSQYSTTTIPAQHASPIDSNTSYDYYNKYLPEYGLTLKNLFTPYRLIKDASKNFYYVDVATTEIIDLTTITKNYVIDGVLLKDGHRVLIKNQTTNVVLLNTADPLTYFTGNYEVIQDLGATIEYQYYNEENGVYLYNNGTLTRETDLDDYKNCIRYSVSVKLGTVNANKQYHLSRILSGYYPTTLLAQPIEFKEKHNWILRNRVDYNNLFEINYYDIIKHGTQSYNYEGITYSIPERTLSVGEFGVILNTQESKSNIINNKYKVNLRSITETEKYYWICGDENTLLRVKKHDFFIDRILLEEIPTNLPQLIITNLTSVSFFDNLNGVVVGELNTIFYTKNGGKDWMRIEVSDFSDYNYNKVLYSTNSSFYVAGDVGILIEFVNSISGWTAYKRRISQIEDGVDEYLLVENINDLYKTKISSWNVSYNYYTQSIPTDKELLFLVTNNSKIIAYDINNSFNNIGTDFIYFDFGQDYKDIKRIDQKLNTDYFYFTGTDVTSGDDGIFSFDINNFSILGTGSSYSNTAVGTSATFEYAAYVNQLFDYKGTDLLICGNTSLLGTSTYSVLNFNSLDSTFEDKLKSKLLVIDYDIASKLNFFTDAGEYRLPNSITFSNSTLASVNSKIAFRPIEHAQTSTNNGTYSETNWITYWTDTQKTFEFYNGSPLDESTQVLISTTFSYSQIAISLTYSSVQVTASASQISYLAPMITSTHSSRFDAQGLPSISAPTISSSVRIFLYDYLMVYKVTTGYPVSIGDVLKFESDVVDTELIVNKIVTLGSWDYIYMFTEFNQNIINDLQLTTGSISITNLNRYTNVAQLKNRFNSHPISNAYKLDYIDIYGNVTSTATSDFQLSARFNNVTSYYNLQTTVNVDAPQQIYTSVYNYQFSGGVSSSINYATATYYFANGVSASNYIFAGATLGASGDGFPAIGARLNHPVGLRYYQPTDTYYIADSNNGVIRSVDNTGIIDIAIGPNYIPAFTPNFSPAPGTPGTSYNDPVVNLYLPTDIDFDNSGCMYIATGCTAANFHIIRKVDYNLGTIEDFAGSGPGGYIGHGVPALGARLNTPIALCYSTVGNTIYNDKLVYIADSENHCIRVVDFPGNIWTYVGDSSGPSAGYGGDGLQCDNSSVQLNTPTAVAIDPNTGDLYIADKNNFVIRKVDINTNIITTFAGTGTMGYNGDGGLATSAKLGYTTGVTVDNFGNVYIVSNDGLSLNTIRKVNTSGIISTVDIVSGTDNLERIIMDKNSNDILYSNESFRVTGRTPDISASLVGTITSLPNDGDTVDIELSSNTYTYIFKNSPSGSYDVQIESTISDCVINLATVSNSTLSTSYVSNVNYSGNSLVLTAVDSFGDIPNSNNNWKIDTSLSTIVPSTSATMSAPMVLLPTEDDSATIHLGTTYSTYVFKNTPNISTNEIQLAGTINDCLDNLLLGITSSAFYSTYLSSSLVSGTAISLTATSSFGSIPNTNSNWQLSYSLTTTGIFQTSSYDMVYTNGFLKFGYSPTYNLLDYLTSINNTNDVNPKFYASKEYLAMPKYEGLPLGSLTSSTVYIDYNGMTYSGGNISMPGNKILFGSGLKLEWDSIFINTFVDIKISGSHSYSTDKLLVMNKYYDIINNAYVIEFHKRVLPISSLNQNILSGCTLDIISRRYLYQISDDLQELNNIQRSKGTSNSWNDQDSYKYDNYQNELNFKIPTDSYAKILLSDSDTIQSLSAIIYIDYKNELAMNITRLSKEYNVPIANTLNYTNKLYISCSEKHDLVDGDGVVLDFTGGVGSSQELNPQYAGYHVITKINEYDFLTDIDYGQAPTVGIDSGYVRYIKKDPFLNYQPVDLIDLGVDGKGKMSLELSIENLTLTSGDYRLINIDYEKYRFRLVDGLNIEIINSQYTWLLEAELSGAVLGSNSNGLVWYKGTWIFGRWFGGTWQSGVWMSGDWYGGIWNSNIVTDKILTLDVDSKTVDFEQSFWYDGRWYEGTWNAGIWYNGRWYGGTWNDGMWHKGIWNDGTWNNGRFEGGIWVLGTWNNGIFNCDNEPAYWLDGKWLGGDFENGMWYNGSWEQKNSLSRFGTKSFNSRTANWQAGTWISGSFYSFLNRNDQGLLDVSDVHKYSIWKTGKWLSGEWYGGIAYNMDFKTGTWFGGILEDIEVIGVNITDNTFILNGIFKFNIGDEIYMIDNQINNANSVYGSNLNPGRYKILYQTEDSINKRTTIYVATNLSGPNISSVTDTGLRIVSRFKNLNWKSGIWTNGIYDTGLWEGGIWYNGVFDATWS